MIILPASASPARRWLAHLLRAASGAIRSGDLFDDELPFDVEAVDRLAMRHRVAPLLYRGMDQGRIADPMPGTLRTRWRGIYYATLRKNTVALEIGSAVQRELVGAGVRAAPLKGLAFMNAASPLYEDPGVRPMDDLDLMIAREDLERAAGVLGGLGFEPSTSRTRARLAGGHEIAFQRSIGGIHLFVELHWAWAGKQSLLRDFGLDGERFLRDFCRPARQGGLEPTEVGHLLFAAVHAARHALGRWIWVLDIHRLVESGRVDFVELLRQARELRVRRPLYAGLAAARELLRSPIPKEVLAELAPGPVRRQLLHRSLAGSGAGLVTARRERVAKLLLGESWWDVARTAAWAAAPGRAWYEERGATPSLPARAAHPLRVLSGGRPSSTAGQRPPVAGRPGDRS